MKHISEIITDFKRVNSKAYTKPKEENIEQHQTVTEYIYLNDDGSIYGTTRDFPMKYEDQTDCIVIECSNKFDMDRLLDLLMPNSKN